MDTRKPDARAALIPPTRVELGPEQLPALHEAASTTSREAQRRFLRGTALQLWLAVAGSLIGVTALLQGHSILAASVAGLSLITAGLVRGYLLATRAERDWYDGRAAAESSKTLAWKYAVGGEPFPLAAGPSVDDLFLSRLRAVMELFRSGIASGGARGVQITTAMREIRALPPADRRAIYDQQRLLGQYSWYSQRAMEHSRSARIWNGVVLTAQIATGVGVVLLAGAEQASAAVPVAAAVATAAAGWLHVRQLDVTGRAYALTAQELAAVRTLLESQSSEDEWALFVDDAEEAISREHTTWRARRGA